MTLSRPLQSRTVWTSALGPLVGWAAARIGIPDAIVAPLLPLLGGGLAALFRLQDRDDGRVQAECIRSGCEAIEEVADALVLDELPAHAAKLRKAVRRIRMLPPVPEPKPEAPKVTP